MCVSKLQFTRLQLIVIFLRVKVRPHVQPTVIGLATSSAALFARSAQAYKVPERKIKESPCESAIVPPYMHYAYAIRHLSHHTLTGHVQSRIRGSFLTHALSALPIIRIKYVCTPRKLTRPSSAFRAQKPGSDVSLSKAKLSYGGGIKNSVHLPSHSWDITVVA